VVADLTADTFVAVIISFETFDPRKGTARAWVFGIARRVCASYCEAYSRQEEKLVRLARRRHPRGGLGNHRERLSHHHDVGREADLGSGAGLRELARAVSAPGKRLRFRSADAGS
jgi:DNA-directed RNA polymerase specialized sigma24 family protein